MYILNALFLLQSVYFIPKLFYFRRFDLIF